MKEDLLESGNNRCIGCGLCEKICPANCIRIDTQLDDKSRKFVNEFDNIIYISCNPETLKRDLETLAKNRKIKAFAFFDQFPYTNHLECGVVLEK